MVAETLPTRIEHKLPEMRCPECRELMVPTGVTEHRHCRPPTIRYQCVHPDCGSIECLVTSL